MRRKLILVVVLILCGVAYGDEWKKDFTVGQKPQLHIDASDARIEVHPGGPNISIRVTTSGWKIGPGDVHIYDRQSGDVVNVDVRTPHRNIITFGSRYYIHVDVTLPVNTAVDLSSGDGAIVLTGLKSSARLSTGDGHIEVRDFSGPLKAHTGDGRMEIDGRFDALDLETGDGRIECTVRDGSKMADRWRVRTSDGSVTLRLPKAFPAEIDAQTGDGHIELRDLNLQMKGPADEHRVHGAINGGGQLLSVQTGDGSIELSY